MIPLRPDSLESNLCGAVHITSDRILQSCDFSLQTLLLLSHIVSRTPDTLIDIIYRIAFTRPGLYCAIAWLNKLHNDF